MGAACFSIDTAAPYPLMPPASVTLDVGAPSQRRNVPTSHPYADANALVPSEASHLNAGSGVFDEVGRIAPPRTALPVGTGHWNSQALPPPPALDVWAAQRPTVLSTATQAATGTCELPSRPAAGSALELLLRHRRSEYRHSMTEACSSSSVSAC